MGLQALKELLIGVAILAALNAGLVPGDPGLLRVSPHPLVFVVALIAVRRGPTAGLVAGIASAALHIAAQVAVARGASAAPAHLLDALRAVEIVPPLGLALLGITLGEIRRRQGRSEVAMRRASDEARSERDLIRTRLALSETTRQELERRAVEPAAILASVHDGIDRLGTLDPAGLHQGVVDLVARHLLSQSAAIYMLEGGKLRRMAFRGGDPEPPETRDPEEGLLGAALRERRTLSARDALGRGELTGKPLETILAAPLVAEDGTPLGAIAVESMPLVSLTASAERVLAMLAAAASRPIARSAGRLRQDDARIYDETVGALRYGHLLERLADEFERSRRYKVPFSLLILEITGFDSIPPAGKAPLRKALAQALRNGVRKVDHVYIYKDERSFAVTLPHTPEAGAELVRDRIRLEIDRYGLAPYRREGKLEYLLGTATRVDAMRSPADMAATAEDAARAAPPRPIQEEERTEEELLEDGTERFPALTPEAIAAARAAAAAEQAKEAGARAKSEAPAAPDARAEAPAAPRAEAEAAAGAASASARGEGTEKEERAAAAKAASEAGEEAAVAKQDDETGRYVAKKEAIAAALEAEKPPEEAETDGDIGEKAKTPPPPPAAGPEAPREPAAAVTAAAETPAAAETAKDTPAAAETAKDAPAAVTAAPETKDAPAAAETPKAVDSPAGAATSGAPAGAVETPPAGSEASAGAGATKRQKRKGGAKSTSGSGERAGAKGGPKSATGSGERSAAKTSKGTKDDGKG